MTQIEDREEIKCVPQGRSYEVCKLLPKDILRSAVYAISALTAALVLATVTGNRYLMWPAIGSACVLAFLWHLLRSTQIEYSRRLSHEIGQLQENLREDFFTKLVNINFKYIELYYAQTREQADGSFRLAAVAAAVSLAVIIAGIVMMFFNKTTPAYVTTGAGVIGEFIAAVFFYLYNRTILKMGQYHQKLVLTQNVSLALKIAEGLPEAEKAKAQLQLIECLTKDINALLSRAADDGLMK